MQFQNLSLYLTLLTRLWWECDFIHTMVFRAGFTCCSSLLGSNLWNVQSAAGHKPCSSAAAVAQLDLLSPVGMGQLQHLGRSCCFHGQKKRHAKSGGEKVTYKESGGFYRFWGFLQSLAGCFPSAIRRALTAPDSKRKRGTQKWKFVWCPGKPWERKPLRD